MADSRIYLAAQPILPIDNHGSYQQNALTNKTKTSFADLLENESKKVNFSHHAAERLRERNIDLSAQDLSKLDDIVDKMSAKGARESLVYMNDIAMVVSVTNRTVITAMDGNSAKENIFTNIDSAAII